MSVDQVQSLPVMNKSENLVYRFMLWVGTILTIIFFFWWFQSSHIAHNFTGIFHTFDYVLFGLVSYVVWSQIINEVYGWYVAAYMRHPVPMDPIPGMKVAFLTAFVPGSEPYEILENTLQAMVNTEYPHDTWVLDEGDDPRVKTICARLGVKHYSRKGIPAYNTISGAYKIKTKGGNYNSWFDSHGHKYDIMAQLDVDFTPKPNYLNKVLGYFRDQSVAFVGTPQIYGNVDDSWIAKGAAQQSYGFYGPTQKGLFGLDMTLFIGANHAIRTSAHDDIDGYAGHIVEDHLTGMKLYAKKWKSVYVPEILAVGEGPSTWSSYFSQQMRWSYGLIDILFRHTPKLIKDLQSHHKINYFLLQQYYFYGLSQVIGILLLSLYFVFGIEVTPMKVIGLLTLYIPLLIFQQIFSLWLQRFNIEPHNERGLLLTGKMLSVAAWPIYFIAFLSALLNKRIQYTVTPKGDRQNGESDLSQLFPHFILGSITLICLFFAYHFARYASMLIFWSIVNSVTMYSFIIAEVVKKIREYSYHSIFRYSLATFSIIFISLGSYLTLKDILTTPRELISPLSGPLVTINQGSILTGISTESKNELEPKYVGHLVVEGETLWSIAHDYLGSGYSWVYIENPKTGKNVQPGDIVYLPSALVISKKS